MRPQYDPRSITAFVDGASVLVVIVNYRTPALTIAALRSLAAEAAADPSIRVVVIDNPSGDDSYSVIADAIAADDLGGWAMVVAAEHNGGYAYGNNLAIRPALESARRPRYVWLLNPDTEAKPGALSALVEFMSTHLEVGIAGSCILEPDGTVWGTAFRFPTALGELEASVRAAPVSWLLQDWIVPRQMGEDSGQVDWVPGASMIIRPEVFDRVGLMDEKYFLYYEETDFCLQARRAGFTCWYVATSRVMHMAGQSTGISSRDKRPGRRPQYLFDSRRRYFLKNHGFLYAALADLAFTCGFATWRLRRILQRRPDTDPPHLLLDSLRNSVLLRPGRGLSDRR